jgi:hypothetical protein
MKDPPKLDNQQLMVIIVNQLIGNSKGIHKWLYYWVTMSEAHRLKRR